MRLIDADALMRQVTEEKREAPNWDYAVGYCDAIKRVECMIGEAPTVAEDNNVPVKQPDPITGLVPCGCGGVTEQTDFHDGFFPYSKVECLECGNEIMRAGNTASEAHSEAKRAWNTSHGYTAPPRPGAKEQSYES